MVEQSLVFMKPDVVKDGQVGAILQRFEEAGFEIKQAQLLTMSEILTDRHYEEHVSKPFYPGLKDYIMSGPIFVMVLSGEDAIGRIREMLGATDPKAAAPGTIRAEFGKDMTHNAVHASDSVASAEREMANFFG